LITALDRGLWSPLRQDVPVTETGERSAQAPSTRLGTAAPLAALVGAVLIWSTTFPVSDDAVTVMSPAVLTTLRFTLACVSLVPLILRRQVARAAPMRPLLFSRAGAFLGLTGVAIYYALQNVGLVYTTAGTASLMQALLPAATAVIAARFLGERLGTRVVLGLLLSTAGVALVASGAARLDAGAVLIGVGVVCYGGYTVALRRWSTCGPVWTDPVALAVTTSSWGVILLLPWLAGEVAFGQARWPHTLVAWGELVYLGVLPSGLALLLWTYGAARVRATVSGVLTAAMPVVGYAFSVVLGEPATWEKTGGGVLAVGGMLVALSAPLGDTSPP
jgi:drug/metabolite transporter (DMT)-like permease